MRNRYFICEDTGKEKNALSKARIDTNIILKENGWKEERIHRKNENQCKLIHYIRMGFWTFVDWNRIVNNVEPGSMILIQFPMINSLAFNIAAAKKMQKNKKRKDFKIILLIHDIDSIRFPEDKEKQLRHEQYFWELADVIIAHNKQMKEYLMPRVGNKPIIELEIFDYLMSRIDEKEAKKKQKKIVIAGNLDGDKAGYLWKLKEVRGCSFELYGPHYDIKMSGDNVEYKGVYPPDELSNYIDGGFGLIWDGISINTCTGSYGEYLRYNNPHKASFYLALGIPVIIWRQAALAGFIEKNKLGLVIDDLCEIREKLSLLFEQYEQIMEQVNKVSCRLKNGDFLKKALEESMKYV